ncbi:MAG: 4Fe-4S dicluster domain-containing protein [Armatimonadetes bacterium]|nr:4Fe-4S dicluster domain-containing protein [Armatimonadota bacterium]
MVGERILLAEASGLCEEIERRSGQSLRACYQCGECTAGCPVSHAADLTPNQVTRLLQLGQDNEVLRSSMIWLCAGCETCATRCPRGVSLSRVMDALREAAVLRGIPAGEPAIRTFHETFLRAARHHGRIHEISMLMECKLRSRHLFSDLLLGAKLLLKGKLALISSPVRDRDKVEDIFSATRP